MFSPVILVNVRQYWKHRERRGKRKKLVIFLSNNKTGVSSGLLETHTSSTVMIKSWKNEERKKRKN